MAGRHIYVVFTGQIVGRTDKAIPVRHHLQNTAHRDTAVQFRRKFVLVRTGNRSRSPVVGTVVAGIRISANRIAAGVIPFCAFPLLNLPVLPVEPLRPLGSPVMDGFLVPAMNRLPAFGICLLPRLPGSFALRSGRSIPLFHDRLPVFLFRFHMPFYGFPLLFPVGAHTARSFSFRIGRCVICLLPDMRLFLLRLYGGLLFLPCLFFSFLVRFLLLVQGKHCFNNRRLFHRRDPLDPPGFCNFLQIMGCQRLILFSHHILGSFSKSGFLLPVSFLIGIFPESMVELMLPSTAYDCKQKQNGTIDR